MINLYDILDAADGQLFGEPASQIFTAFAFDPRQVKRGDLFVAIKTERGDGHHFMEEAVQAGAAGLMCTHPPSFDTEGVTVVIMRDVEGALLRWTKYILNKFDVTVIGVAGSNGKSTACAAIAQVMGQRYQVYYHPTDFNGKFAIPLSLSQLTAQHQLVVLELDPTYSGEMGDMLAYIPVTVAAVTSISGPGQDNYSNFVLQESDLLISRLPKDGLAVLNFDQETVRRLGVQSPAPNMTISVDREGASFGADLTAYNLVISIDKTGFDLRYGSDRYLGKWFPLLGAHQAYAALTGLAVGLAFDIPLEDGLKALTDLQPLAGRLRPLTGINNCLLIDDTASASAASFLAALEWLNAIRPKPSARDTVDGQISPHGVIYAILGDLEDVTQHSPLDTKRLGDQLVQVASVIVTEGDSAALLARSALEHGIPLARIHMTFSPQDSAYAIKDLLGPKDVVLVIGGASARMERVTAELLAQREDLALLPRHDQLSQASLSAPANHHTWVQVDLEAIAHNTRLVRHLIGPDCHLMAVVKADGYGHGVVTVSTTALLNGADYLGVGSLEEGITLRKAGIPNPILILNYLPSSSAAEVLKYDLSISLYDSTSARAFNRIASSTDKQIAVHVRLDCGQHGLGLPADEIAVFFRALLKLEHLRLEGMYTHLEMTDRSEGEGQLIRFREAIKIISTGEMGIRYRQHAASSAATLHLPDSHLDMVRVGAALYGVRPSAKSPLPKDFKPALSWKTTVIQVKRVAARMGVDEDGQPFTTKARNLAMLPVGYADGLHTGKVRPWEAVLVKGKRAPVVGSQESYLTLIDVSEIDDVRPGDEVVLIGEQGKEQIMAEEVAEWLGLRPPEVLTALMARLPRVK
jgi:alanine racemase